MFLKILHETTLNEYILEIISQLNNLPILIHALYFHR